MPPNYALCFFDAWAHLAHVAIDDVFLADGPANYTLCHLLDECVKLPV